MTPNKHKFLLGVLDLSQRVIDSALAFGLSCAYILLAITIVPAPPSIVDVLYSETIVYMWALASFIGYTLVFVGVWLRPTPYIKYLNSERLGDFYLFFEYPGLIVSALSTFVYSGALIIKFGIFSSSWVAICFTLAIAAYFFFRFLKLQLVLVLSKELKEPSLKE